MDGCDLAVMHGSHGYDKKTVAIGKHSVDCQCAECKEQC